MFITCLGNGSTKETLVLFILLSLLSIHVIVLNSIEKGELDEIQRVLEQHSHLVSLTYGFEKRTPLHKASEYGHPLVCQMLIQFGASVDEKDAKQQTPLWLAARKRNADICHLLISHGADIYSLDETNTVLLDFVPTELRSLFSYWKDLHGKFFFITFDYSLLCLVFVVHSILSKVTPLK